MNTAEAFVDAIGEALHELIENIRFDPKRHERAFAAIQRKAALADPGFRRFMDATVRR